MSKVLVFDIETAPCMSYIWGLYQEVNSTNFIQKDWYVICWSAKWLGEKKIFNASSRTENDYQCVKALWKLIDEADVLIAHNGDRFDVKKINARFIIHGMKAPSTYRTIDTLKAARANFKFTSNRLTDIGQYLKVGKKMDTGGFDLWKGCMKGELKSIRKMQKYCDQDVKLLEKVYLKLRPYMKTHPNIALMQNRCGCANCGSIKVQYRGYQYTNTSKYRRYQCTACGSWGRSKKKVAL